MLAHIDNYVRPQSLGEALELLGDPNNSAIPVAGATAVGLGQGIRQAVKTLVDLSDTGLDRVWEDEAGLHIGAMVRASRVYRDSTVRQFLGDALPEAAFAIGSEPIRNLCSLGGNVVHLTSWSDTPPALQALNASFRVQGTSDRTYSCDEFFANQPKKLLNKGDLLTEIIVPRPLGASAFLKHCKTAVDFALVNAAAVVDMDGDIVREVRLSVGAIHTPPLRITDAEDAVRGNALEDGVLASVAAATAAQVSPRVDPRGSEVYLRHSAGILIRRSLVLAAERAGRSA